MKHIKRFNEAFDLPIGRTQEIKDLLDDTFADIKDYKGVEVDFSIGLKKIEIGINIPELLTKNEIISLYDEVLESKIQYLESVGLTCRNVNKWDNFFSPFYRYKKMEYVISSNKVRLIFLFDRFKKQI